LGAPQSPTIFIGHGRSTNWLQLRQFLSQDLGLSCDEFNTEPIAGMQTSDRIESMLATAHMAFLVMTAEDQHADGSVHARENVIHEIGLFQAHQGQS
jgi:predicted nucleotide-binding protein